MTSTGFTEMVGCEAITARLSALTERLDTFAVELAANQREYKELTTAHRAALAEYDRLRSKLIAYDRGT